MKKNEQEEECSYLNLGVDGNLDREARVSEVYALDLSDALFSN